MQHASTPSGGQPENHRAGSPAIFNATAEAERLRKTIALADEAIREAAKHRSADHAKGETAEETAARWNEAAEIEAAARCCRKAARAALTRVTGVVITAPERRPGCKAGSAMRLADWIEAARAAALGLKRAIDAGQAAAARRALAAGIDKGATRHARHEAAARREAARKKGGAL